MDFGDFMKLSSDEIKQVINLYINENKSATELSRLYNCSLHTILNYLKRNNIQIKNSGHWHKKVELEDIKRDYFEYNMSLTEIGEKYNITTGSLCERFKSAGIKLRDQKGELRRFLCKIQPSEYSKICDLYISDKTQNCGKLAEKYGVCKSTIATILKHNGIILENKGSRLNCYRGGITPLHTRIRNCEKAQFWKRACLERDGYKCKITKEAENLQVHHFPKTFSEIFEDFLRLYPNLKPIESVNELFNLSQDYEPFWNINNGITISEKMHKKLHTNKGITNEEIIILYEQGWSCEKISKHFGKSRAFALSRLRSLNYERRSAGSYNINRSKITDEIIKNVLELYLRGDKIKYICDINKISSGQLYSILEKNNIQPGNRKFDQRSDASKNTEKVNRLHMAGATVQELARMYQVCDETIRQILKDYEESKKNI